MIVKPRIRKELLPINEFSRPGRKLVDIKGIAIHWTGNAGATVNDHVAYFNSLAKQNPNDDEYDRYAGAHYFVDIKGEIVQMILDKEMAYHVGAREYKENILNKFNTTYPNNCLIGVEMCHPDWTGEFTEETYNQTLHLLGFLIEHHDLTLDDVVRHYDVTGKNCPKWFVENEDAYQKFRSDLQKLLRESSLFDKKIKRIEQIRH